MNFAKFQLNKMLKSRDYTLSVELGIKEIHCSNCRKKLGKYNEKYFSDAQLNEIIVFNHIQCIRAGHDILIYRM